MVINRLLNGLVTCGIVSSFLACVAYASPPPLNVARHSSIVLVRDDDKVYVLGGFSPGGVDGTTLLDSAELYDWRRGSLPIASGVRMYSPRNGAALLSRNRILVCDYPPCYSYSPETNQWDRKDIRGSNWTTLVTLDDGSVLLAGGSIGLFGGGLRTTPDSYVIDPNSFAARSTRFMTAFRARHAMLKLSDGKVLAAGGNSSGVGFSNSSAEIFDPLTSLWTAVAAMSILRGSVDGVALQDGSALVIDSSAAEVYSPLSNEWRVVPGLRQPSGSSLTLLPDGQVLIAGGVAGGLDDQLNPLSTVAVFDPVTMTIRSGKPMSIPRSAHSAALLHDGTLLMIGGITTGGVVTASVEKITWEPRIAARLTKGFYVTEAWVRGSQDGGLSAIEVSTPGRLDGGMNFGGSLPRAGAGVGFAAFYLETAQTVTGSVNFKPFGSGPFQVTVRLLDVDKRPVAPEITGSGNRIEFSRDLPAGYYVLELRTSDRSPPAAYQFALSAPTLSAGAVAGGVLDPVLGVVGFNAFYLPEDAEVVIRLYNENTYGSPPGAAEVILTLHDASGRVIARSGPGAQ